MTVSSLGGWVESGTDLPARRVGGRFAGEHVLVPRLAPSAPVVTDQFRVATSLADPAATLSLIDPLQHPVKVRTSVSDEELDTILESITERVARPTGLGYTRDVVAAVLHAVRREDVDTLVLPSASAAGRLRAGMVDRIAAHASCDVIVVNGRSGYERVASLLVPIAGGPHSGLAAEIAGAIAADRDAWIDLVHVIDNDASESEREHAQSLLSEAARRIRRPATTTLRVLEGEEVAETIIEQSRCYDLTVLGAPTKHRLRRLFDDSTNRSVRKAAGSLVLSARNNRRREA